MADTIEVVVTIKKNGEHLAGLSPIYRRIVVDQFQTFALNEAPQLDNTTFTQLPVDDITSVQVFFITQDKDAVGVRAVGGEASAEAIRVDSGGFVFLFNVEQASGNFDVNVPDTVSEAARLRGFAGGS